MSKTSFVVILFLFACQGNIKSTKQPKIKWIPNQYATLFKIGTCNLDTFLHIKLSQTDTAIEMRYFKGNSQSIHGYNKINTSKKLALAGPTLFYFAKLVGNVNNVLAIDNASYFTDSLVLNMVNLNTIKEFATTGNTNMELLQFLKVDYLWQSGVNSTLDATMAKNRFGIHVISFQNHLESSPLGSAEWLKVASFLQGNGVKSLAFNAEVLNFNNLCKQFKPTITQNCMVNSPWQGIWYVPGQKSVIAQLLQSAGFKINPVFAGSKTINCNLEQVLFNCKNVPYWINAGNEKTLAALNKTNYVFKNFKATKFGLVFNPTRQLTNIGANAYFEILNVQPSKILQDFMFIQSKEYSKLNYYEKLK